MNRRNFLRGLLVSAAAVATVAVGKVTNLFLPRIFGDGIHDDTAGLQAAINGEEFVSDKVVLLYSPWRIYVGPGTYRISATLDFSTAAQDVTVGSSIINGDEIKSGAAIRAKLHSKKKLELLNTTVRCGDIGMEII